MKSKTPPPAVKSFWAARVTRKVLGITVSFYKRYEASCYTMDFKVRGERVRTNTEFPTVADAERVALKTIREMKEAKNGLTAAAARVHRAAGACATVREVMTAMRGGDMTVSDRTLEEYLGALRRLAEVVDAVNPWDVTMDRVVTKGTLDGLVLSRQGGTRIDRINRLRVNTGINTLVREVKSVLGRRHREKLANLKLPPLTALDDWLPLPEPDHRFVKLPQERYAAMCAAAQELRTAWPELWLVHMLVRLLGLRNEELMAIQRHWIEAREDGVYLVIKDRPGEWSLLKHGLPADLWLDPALAVLLLACGPGHLVLPGAGESTRYDLIYRRHNDWLRTFIPRSERQKGAHELRKHVGSVVLAEHGADAAQRFLRQKSRRVFEEHYSDWLKPLPRVTTSMIGAA